MTSSYDVCRWWQYSVSSGAGGFIANAIVGYAVISQRLNNGNAGRLTSQICWGFLRWASIRGYRSSAHMREVERSDTGLDGGCLVLNRHDDMYVA